MSKTMIQPLFPVSWNQGPFYCSFLENGKMWIELVFRNIQWIIHCFQFQQFFLVYSFAYKFLKQLFHMVLPFVWFWSISPRILQALHEVFPGSFETFSKAFLDNLTVFISAFRFPEWKQSEHNSSFKQSPLSYFCSVCVFKFFWKCGNCNRFILGRVCKMKLLG